MSSATPRPPSQQVAARTGSRTGSRGHTTASSPSSISSQPLSVEEHQREVTAVVSQVTQLLQRRLVQHESDFQEVLVAHTPPQHQRRQDVVDIAPADAMLATIPCGPSITTAAVRTKSPARRQELAPRQQDRYGDDLDSFMPGSDILGEDPSDSPSSQRRGGGPNVVFPRQPSPGAYSGVTATAAGDTLGPAVGKVGKAHRGSIVPVLPTSKSPALSSLSVLDMSGPSVISVPTHAVNYVAGSGRLDSGGSSHFGHMSTGAPTVRLSPAASAVVYPSGQALVQQIAEEESGQFLRRSTSLGSMSGGSPPTLRRPSPTMVPSNASPGRNSIMTLPPALQSLSPPPLGNGLQSPPPSHPQAEKWKQRVSHIAGPVQLGSKDTLFGVRNEIEQLHKQHPADAKALQNELERTTEDLIGAFAVINDTEYKRDTEELKEQIKRTDDQIAAEVAQHNKMVGLLETAVTMLNAAATTGGEEGDASSAAPDETVEELRAKLNGESNEGLKKKLALRLFLTLSKLKVSKEKAIAGNAVAVRAEAPPADVRDALLSQAKEAALAAGVHLDREARRKQSSTHAPLDVTALNQKAASDGRESSSTTKQQASGAPARSVLADENDDGDLSSSTSSAMGASYNTMARRMSSFRRGNPAAAAALGTGATITPRASVGGQQRGSPTTQASTRRQSNFTSTTVAEDDPTMSNSISFSMSAAHGSPLGISGGKRNSTVSVTAAAGFQKNTGASKAAPRIQRQASNLSIKSPAGSVNNPSSFLDILDTSYLNNQVYTSAQRLEASQLLSASGITLRSQAEAAIAAAEADYAKRVARESAQKQRLESRSMDQILRDAIDNRAPSPIRHMLREDLDEILKEGQAALALADQMETLAKQTADSVQLREELLGKAKRPLMVELRELEERVMRNTASLHTAHQDRKLLVKQYWQWRHRVELGDVKAGHTFEEELSRGPRFRHVGVQNVIQTEYLAQQVLWLKQLLRREETFRRHVARIETLVNELKEMNQQVDCGLMCPVCHRMCVDPVVLWPCGHSFCQGACLDSLQVSTYLHRCAVCFSVGSEGALPNVLLAEIIAKWTVKEKSYSNVSHSLDEVKAHMSLFERDKVQMRLNALEFRARQVLNIGYCT